MTRTALFTDQYQLVMAQLYVAEGWASTEARFDYFYRSNPDYGGHQAGFAVFAGLSPLLDWMETVRFGDRERRALADLRGSGGQPVFDAGFIDWLGEHGHFADLEVRAVAEGRVVHPHVPIVSVEGPLPQAQLLETALLNHLNYPTLIATKASRIAQAARGRPVLEFGMRRGPGVAVDEAARAALIGGCAASSNVQASVALGTEPKGTHAHSMVQAYLAAGGGELAAFRAFARCFPDDCTLLVDTVDTLDSGMPNAITVLRELADAGHGHGGVRLDSGDLAFLAVRAAAMLDDAGLTGTNIVLSGDLDELTMWQIHDQMADDCRRHGVDLDRLRDRLVYGVGTRLITSAGDGALGGVYKLVAVTDDAGAWEPAVKLSENPEKIPIPGNKVPWRLYDRRGLASADLLTVPGETPAELAGATIHHPSVSGSSRTLTDHEREAAEPLQQVVFSGGRRRVPAEDIDALADRCRSDVERLDVGVRRLVNPHRYHVSLSDELKAHRDRVVAAARRP